MPITWKDFGIGAANDLVGGLVDSAFGALQGYQNYRYNEKAADNADQRQRQQFKDMYSIGAQMQQLKDAGLSPSLFFGGMPSQGGATAPQGAGNSGPMINTSPLDLLTTAQIDAIKEDTRGKKIENDNKQEAIDADIALKLSQAGLNKASEAYKNVQTEREELFLTIDEITTQDQINERINRANKMYWESWLVAYECRSAAAQAEVDEATIKTRINAETAKYQELLTNIKVGESVVRLNDATIQNMALEIGIAAFRANTERMSYEAQKKWFEDQIKNQIDKLAQDKTIAEEQIKAMKQGQWINFSTDIFGSIVNGASAMSAAALH